MKKILSFTLIIAIVFSTVPLYGNFSAFAENLPDEDVVELFLENATDEITELIEEDSSEVTEDFISDEDGEAELFADNSLPEIGEIVFEEYFSKSSYDSRITPYITPADGGNLSISDSGELFVTSESSTTTGAKVYVNADKTAVTSGEFVIQFKLTRPDSLPTVFAHISSAQDKPIVSYVWGNSSGGGNLKYSNTQGVTQSNNKSYKANDKKTSILVTMKVDTDAMKFWLWFDSTLAVDGKYPRDSRATNLGVFSVYTEGAGINFSLDDIVFYTPPGPSDAELIQKDYDLYDFDYVFGGSVNEDDILKANVNLPTTGAYGSKITWSSSDEKLLTSDGKFTYADSSYETNPEIKLTATFTLGEESLTREYLVRIISESELFKGSGIPEIGEIIYENNFSISDLDERIEKTIPSDDNGNEIGHVEVNDGSLEISYNSDADKAGAVGAKIYMNEDKSALESGRYVTQFKLSRPADKPYVLFRVGSATNQNLLGFNWGNTDSKGRLYYRKSTTSADQFAYTGIDNKTSVIVTVEYLLDIGRMSVWFDTSLVLDKVLPRSDKATDLGSITIYTEQKGAKFRVDDFRVYAPVRPENNEMVKLDYDALSFDYVFGEAADSKGVLKKGVALPLSGPYGSEISWESSNDKYLTSDGGFTYAQSELETNPEVILTATFKAGDETLTKEFKVKIAKENEIYVDLPKLDSVIYENDFSVNNPDDLHYEFNPNGGNIEIKDGALHITRSENTSMTRAYIYPNEKHTPVSGLLGVSYCLKKQTPGRLIAKIQQPQATDFLMIIWSSDDSITVYGSNTKGGASTYYKVGKFASNSLLRVDALLNCDDGMYTLWLNGEKVVTNKYSRVPSGSEVGHLLFYLEGNDFLTFTIDDVKIYNVVLTGDVISKRDYDYLIADRLVTGDVVHSNVINSDLNLPDVGPNGSTITWTSSDERYISNDGKITNPVDAKELPVITLTALIESDGYSMTKKFDFRVKSVYSSPDIQAKSEMDNLKGEEMLSQSDKKTNYVRTSLNLPDTTHDGTPIIWTSSNEKVITSGGRVTRPRYNEPVAVVNMTATICVDGKTYDKVFEFTVIPDEEWEDPNHMTDEEFFGKWNGSKWEIEGKLDYSISSLSDAEKHAKNGDYDKAKEALLSHMRLRNPPSNLLLETREKGYVDNMAIVDMHTLQTTDYYQGHVDVKSTEYSPYYITVKDAQIKKGGITTYGIIAKYNEVTKVFIASMHHPNPEYRPQIEFKLNGKLTTRYASASAGVRAGSYGYTNYYGLEELPVKMFGEHLSDETYKVFLNFDFSDLKTGDTVSDVRLILHSRLEQSYVDSKELVVINEPQNIDERTVNWNTNLGYVYNFNGLLNGTIWDEFTGFSDFEYDKQMARFPHFDTITSEYIFSEDEKYAYYMIDTMMDFISDRGGPRNTGQGWPKDRPNMAGWPRTLDTASRMQLWATVLCYIAKSEYMTPEALTAIMKTLWHMVDSVTYSTIAAGNWFQIEKNSIIELSIAMPEYESAKKWRDDAVPAYESLVTEKNYYPDGAYKEKTAGYSQDAHKKFIRFKGRINAVGYELSEKYDDILLKGAYYNAQLYFPSGESLNWGDSGDGKRTGALYPDIVRMYGDREYQFVDTFGAKGDMPDWTSMQFTDSTTTFMRSDWSKNALYMHTQSRGYGQHGHQDDNGVMVGAYGRPLLVDSGLFSYTETDPERIWGKSTAAHNTVEINEVSQEVRAERGKVDDWTTYDSFDFSSIISHGYAEVPHIRKVMFVKPDLWIVSDLMTPENKSEENIYKQIWHMHPEANLGTDEEAVNISSNYISGANIVVASADDDTIVEEAAGKYSSGYGKVRDSKYAYFKKVTDGNAVFDTVLVPSRSGKASVATERLSTGRNPDEISAIKFTTEIEGEKNTYHYMLSHIGKPESEIQFGKFATDGELALVCENEKGSIERIVLRGASYLKLDGKRIFESESEIDDISVVQTGTKLEIDISSKKADGTEMSFENVKTVYVNGEVTAFIENSNDKIVLTDEKTTVEPNRDPTDGKGGIGSKGGSGGGGGSSGIPVVTPDNPGAQSSAHPFDDISSHWAKDYILDLYSKGVVKGDGNRRFNPDGTVTRAEFLAMVLRGVGIKESEYRGGFDDVKADDWFSPIVQAGLDNGIISEDTVFRPNDIVTREEMCKILVISAGEKLSEANAELSFADADSISEWAKEYVLKAYAHGIIRGKDNGCFEPKSSATRAEAATVISRLN